MAESPPNKADLTVGNVHLVEHTVIERYRGRWVAIDQTGDVVADAADLGSLLTSLEELGMTADTVQRVPRIDEPLFVGLS